MGCDIHSYVEIFRDGKWEFVDDIFECDKIEKDIYKKERRGEPFWSRNYGVFGFLADVRNYSHTPVIRSPRGLPNNLSQEVQDEAAEWVGNAHTHSFLLLNELLDFNYDADLWDMRVTRQVSPRVWDGSCRAEDGEGKHITLRKFLGEAFFADLEAMRALGDPRKTRIVFWFDN